MRLRNADCRAVSIATSRTKDSRQYNGNRLKDPLLVAQNPAETHVDEPIGASFLDIFDIFEDIGGCALIAIVAVIILVLVICVVLAVVVLGAASWF